MKRWLLVFVVVPVSFVQVQEASALSTYWGNCEWSIPANGETWNAGCDPHTNSCHRFDSPATVTDEGSLNTVYGTEMCNDNCYKPADAIDPEVCCTNAGPKTLSLTTSVTDKTTWNVSAATERKINAEGTIIVVTLQSENDLKIGWGYAASTSRTLSFTVSRTVQECRKVCDKGTMEIRENKKVEIVHTYKLKRQSSHYGLDGVVCICWTPCWTDQVTSKSTASGNFQTANASSQLSGNTACGDPPGACGG